MRYYYRKVRQPLIFLTLFITQFLLLFLLGQHLAYIVYFFGLVIILALIVGTLELYHYCHLRRQKIPFKPYDPYLDHDRRENLALLGLTLLILVEIILLRPPN